MVDKEVVMRNKVTIFLVFLLSVALLLTGWPSVYADNAMDTAAEWALDEIVQAKEQGLAGGAIFHDDFSAAAPRGEFADYAVRIYRNLATVLEMSEEMRPYNNQFSDVPVDVESIALAYSYNIINGVTESEFDLSGNITREQLCAMLYRIKQRVVYETTYDYGETQFQANFNDIDQISDWAFEAVKYMNAEGVIRGRGNSLDPKGNVTRQEAILMGYRLYMMLRSHQIETGTNQARPITTDMAYRNMAIARTFAENQALLGDEQRQVWLALKTYVNMIGEDFYTLQAEAEKDYYVLSYDQTEVVLNTMFHDTGQKFDDIFLLSYQTYDDIFYQEIDQQYYFFIEKEDAVKSNCTIVQNIRDEDYKTVGFLVVYSDNDNNAECEVYFTERNEHNSFDQFYYEVSDFIKR